MDLEEDPDGDQCHMIATIRRRQLPTLVAEVCVNGSWISMEVDTGATVSIVSECTYRLYLDSVTLKKSCVSLRTFCRAFGGCRERVWPSVSQWGTTGLEAHSG